MADFVLYLLGHFALRCRMVGLYPKSKKSTSLRGLRSTMQSQNQQQRQNLLTTKDTKDTKEDKGLPQMNVDRQERLRQRAEALVRRIGETCDELDRLAEENGAV